MPYSGAADTSLPAAVQKLPKALRELWVRVFNENYKAEDEAWAFKMAWGAVRKVQSAKKARALVEIDMDDVKPWLLGVKASKTDGGATFGAGAYLFVPDKEKPSTWKIRIEETPGKVTIAQLGRAAAALSAKGFMGNPTQGIGGQRRAMAKRLIGLYRSHGATDADIPDYLWGLAGMTSPKAEKAAQDLGLGLQIKQQADGRWRWITISSGAFEDRDGEILSQAFLEDAVTYAAEKQQLGTTDMWHLKNSDMGICDFQMLVGEPPLLLESGLFDDTPAGLKAAQYYAAHAPEMGVSLQFGYINRSPEGVYSPPGVIVRRSFLPRAKAAFGWSAMQVKEPKMAQVTPEKIAHVAEVFGISLEQATHMIEHLESGAKTLADYGVNWKEISEPEAVDDTPEVVEPAPVEPAVVEPAATEPASVEPVVAEPQATEVILGPEVIEQMATRVLAAVNATLQEVRTALEALASNQTTLGSALSAQAQGLKELDATVKSLKAADDAKIAAAVKDLPRATVKSLQAGERPSQRQPDAQTPQESQLARMKQVIHG